ncbi:MAG: DNA polymerase III subunit gamma/tau [Candidatus Aminicenantes bacterium]|nr:DNA polymerase III subunit gamma/tau [Candidatus Aminicenantes bacterium]
MSEKTAENNKSGYLVLARKYRPKKFSEVVGQEAVVRTLQNAIKENRIGHAYLFSGMRGVGKTTVARILAKALNCEHGPTPEPCNQCFMCTAINEETLLDFIEIDGASNRGIEDVKALRESIQYEPMHSRYRVIIIDEVHQLSRDAFNALLKTLEEPPTRTVFIFATTEFHKVPKTIASRCQHFVFKKLSNHDIVEHLRYIAGQEGIIISPYSLKLIAEAADGSLRDAETLLDQVVSFSGNQVNDKETEEVLGVINRNLFENFSRAIINGQAGEIFTLVESLISAGYDLRYFYSGLIEYFRNLLLVKISKNPSELLFLSAEEIDRLKQVVADLKAEEILRYISVLQDGEAGLKYSSQPRIFLESWLIRLCYLQKLKPLEQVVEEIGELKKELKKGKVESKNYSSINPGTGTVVKQSVNLAEYKKQNNNTSISRNGFSVFGNEIADELYYRLVKEKPALAPIFKVVNRVEITEKSIQLVYASDKKHFAALLEQNLPYLNRLASELASKEVELRIEENQASNSNPLNHNKINEPARNNEAAVLLQDPRAKALLNTLKGQIIAVKKKPNNNQS